LIRPAYFVPETKKIDDLLSDFQKNKTHMAIVVDEFGGTSGLITMEDILEEIMGEIEDEYDEDESLYTKVDDATYIFEAKILLNDFYRVTDISDAEFEDVAVDVDSLAGLILELKGEIPNKNEKITYKNYTFEILSSDNRRIKKVKFYIEK
jgi:CBS domain containing-hemolysin-like protein